MSHSVTSRVLPEFSAVAELFKPITWFPPMWAFTCGVIASGIDFSGKLPIIFLGLLLTGPMVCATSQAVNDWFDREVDAINEPARPIPSGRIPGKWGLYIAVVWTAASLVVAGGLGTWGFYAALLALALAWAYSMPPVRLKQNGWLGNTACGLSYEGLAWITGSAVMLGGVMPAAESLLLALAYSIGAHGIMTLNDFKSMKGDARMGVDSLPVLLGPQKAALTACTTMIVPQIAVIGLVLSWNAPLYAAGIAALVAGQLMLMKWFLQAPIERALFYSGFGVPLFVSGMMVSAFAARTLA